MNDVRDRLADEADVDTGHLAGPTATLTPSHAGTQFRSRTPCAHRTHAAVGPAVGRDRARMAGGIARALEDSNLRPPGATVRRQ